MAKVLHSTSLGLDPAKGGASVLDEAVTGSRLETYAGRPMTRDLSGNGDWVANNGVTYDGASPPPTDYFNDKTFAQWQNSVQAHLNKQGLDYVVVDSVQRGLTDAQTALVQQYISSLPAAQAAKIIHLY